MREEERPRNGAVGWCASSIAGACRDAEVVPFVSPDHVVVGGLS
jgi:hypothetical protein